MIKIGTVSQDQGLLVQTDKSLYKPGETMKFRVIPIKRDLHTQSDPEVSVKLTSPDGNIMTQWKQGTCLLKMFISLIAVDPNC